MMTDAAPWRVFLSHMPAEIGPVLPPEALERLRAFAEVVANPFPRHLSPAELQEACREMDAVLTEWASGGSAPFFEACPRLKVFARCAATVQNIDLAAATRAGILVVAAPPQFARPMAEFIMGLMATFAYDVWAHHTRLKHSGVIDRSPVGFELVEKTVGIVGLGRVGRALAGVAAAVGMQVLASDPYVSRHDTPAQMVELPELLARSRFVVICVRLTTETRGLIGAREIAQMSANAFLINAAMAGIVDEVALSRALVEGRLAGAAVDVFTDEPDIRGNPLWSAPRTILTPHLGGHSQEGYRAAALAAAEGLRAAWQGFLPQVVVNPEVLPLLRAGHPRWVGARVPV